MEHCRPLDCLRKTRVFLGPKRAHDWFGAIHQGHHHHRRIPAALHVDQYDLSIGIPVRRLDRTWRRIFQRNEQSADARAADADLRAHRNVRFALRATFAGAYPRRVASLFRPQSIPDAEFRHEKLGIRGIRLQLVAKLAHVHP